VALAVVVPRVGFARENELHRAVLVARQLHYVLKLLEDQGRTLVGGETTRKTDGQGVGIQQLIERDEISLRQPLALNQQPPAGELNQLAPQPVAKRPQLFVGKKIRVRHPLPKLDRVNVRVPIGKRHASFGNGAARRLPCEFAPPKSP